MSSGIPRIYTNFAEFEREELRRLDSLHTSVDDLMEERFAEELDFGQRHLDVARDDKPLVQDPVKNVHQTCAAVSSW